eukprot:13509117-Alexandrium_andersonii.AAC.1
MHVQGFQSAAPRAHAPRTAAAATSSELALCGDPGSSSACTGVEGALRAHSPAQDSGAHEHSE